MRRIMIAAGVVALALVGCKKTDVPEARQELAEERQELTQEQAAVDQEVREETAEIRQEASEEVDAEREDVAEARRDLAEAEAEREEALGRGGSGPASSMVMGKIESKREGALVLEDLSGKSYTLKTDASTQFTSSGREVDESELSEGAEVRASYEWKGEERIAREVEVLKGQ
jgi:hypothetical protein